MTLGCFQENAYEKIKKLKDAGDFRQAKREYEHYLKKKHDKAFERSYIQFLFDQKYYIDFNHHSQKYLRENPDDLAINNLHYQYYAILATTSIRQKDYEQALIYIVSNLLSNDYEDHKHWELEQSTVLRKWYAEVSKKEDNLLGRKLVMSKMTTLGLDNLAKSIDPQLYAELQKEGAM
jgi:tetratricopeptide (TPR) repeat protein